MPFDRRRRVFLCLVFAPVVRHAAPAVAPPILPAGEEVPEMGKIFHEGERMFIISFRVFIILLPMSAF